MRAGERGSIVDSGVRNVLAHPIDILRNRPGKQLHLLGEVPCKFAKLAPIPIAQLGTIKPHLAGGWRQTAYKNPSKRRLTRARRAYNGKGLAWLQRETDPIENRFL